MTKTDFLGYLHNGDFTSLFVECGWNRPSQSRPLSISIDGKPFAFREVAQKGLRIFVCEVDAIPAMSVVRSLDSRIRKYSHDYFSIFTLKGDAFHHLWSVPVNGVDKRQLVTVEYVQDSQAEFLKEKLDGITFGIDEDVAVVDVIDRVTKAFLVNSEKVTKSFYQGFSKQHKAFVKGIENIPAEEDREWYASVMLNRLMFCYFLQKKGFLDYDENYLGNKLKWVKEKRGENKFLSFYRSFLKNLFNDGLDRPCRERSDYFRRTYGNIPYLNGGMFAKHELERRYPDIDIPDSVFEALFGFFDDWRWHLDSRLTETGKDINPDVLGYIFEQYINDRAQMGAYYTKEDITEYITRNTLVPWLLNETAKSSPGAFAKNGYVWKSLRESGDRYIFPAVKKGVDRPLPPEIERGVAVEPQNTLRKRRAEWNRPAADDLALPTEIWRETVARRQRCEELRRKIVAGEITDVNDFITFNLDIRAFAEDLVRNAKDHLFVKHFYDALRKVTVLDPTCGSGAFLFAALNVMEPLYETCLDRIGEFHEKDAKLFNDELDEIKGKFRSNQKYFIYKNIILRNLYGVDIMREATEIARLRLFLKMVAAVDVDPQDENLGLDPLPDIDFNIRCGNTLVGYATEQGIQDGLTNGDMFAYAELKDKIDLELQKASMAFEFFRREQLNLQGDHKQLVEAKKEIGKRQESIRKLLDDQLYDRHSGKTKEQWLKDSQPFHWYSEFYDIMAGRGGFDVIIGNPPYVEYSKVKNYTINGYKTESCGNLYAFVIERSCVLQNCCGKFGMILPAASVCTPRMMPLSKVVGNYAQERWVSLWDERPSKLFDGVDQQLAIQLFAKGACHDSVFMTSMKHWSSCERDVIFQVINYTLPDMPTDSLIVPKFGSAIERNIHNKLYGQAVPLSSYLGTGDCGCIYFRTAGGRYWRLIKSFPTYFRSEIGMTVSSKEKVLHVKKQYGLALVAQLAATLFYWFWRVHSDCRDLTNREMLSFPVADYGMCPKLSDALTALAIRYEKILEDSKERKVVNNQRSGRVEQDVYHVADAKPIIDQIDELLAKHYGFTEEELDFIINYDIKYRMGDRLNGED